MYRTPSPATWSKAGVFTHPHPIALQCSKVASSATQIRKLGRAASRADKAAGANRDVQSRTPEEYFIACTELIHINLRLDLGDKPGRKLLKRSKLVDKCLHINSLKVFSGVPGILTYET